MKTAFDALLRTDLNLLLNLNLDTQQIIDILKEGSQDRYVASLVCTKINYTTIEDWFVDNYSSIS